MIINLTSRFRFSLIGLAVFLPFGLVCLVATSQSVLAVGSSSIPPGVGVVTEEIQKTGVGVAALPTGDVRDSFLPRVTRIMLYAMSTVALVIFLAAGSMLVFGFGDQENLKKAKLAIIWGLIGLAFAAGAYTLVQGLIELDLGPNSTTENQIK